MSDRPAEVRCIAVGNWTKDTTLTTRRTWCGQVAERVFWFDPTQALLASLSQDRPILCGACVDAINELLQTHRWDEDDVVDGRPSHVKCVRASDARLQDGTARRAWCGRDTLAEFCFLDPVHAAGNAFRGGALLTCGACVDAIVAAAEAPGGDALVCDALVTALQAASKSAVFTALKRHRWDPKT